MPSFGKHGLVGLFACLLESLGAISSAGIIMQCTCCLIVTKYDFHLFFKVDLCEAGLWVVLPCSGDLN